MDHLVTYVENYFTTFFQNSFGNRQEANRDFVKTPRNHQHHQQETDFDWESRPINVTGRLSNGFFQNVSEQKGSLGRLGACNDCQQHSLPFNNGSSN